MNFDVVIAGGGPAGGTAAAVCGRHGLSVLLVERSNYEAPRIGETLPPGARDLLERIGVWNQFSAAGHRPAYALRSAWGSAEIQTQDYILHPQGRGWQIDRRRFDAMIADEAERSGAQRLHAEVRGRRARDNWEIDVDGTSVRARFVVDATGRSARIAGAVGARRESIDALIAVVANVRDEAREDGGALIESVAHGWWYSARVPGGDLILAFMTDADLWAQRSATWADFLRDAPHTRARIGANLPKPQRILSAGSSHSDPIAGPGWIAVGDAALAADPLSGQGICHAIRSGEQAALAIVAEHCGDAGALTSLAERGPAQFALYLATRARFYSIEQRFPDAPFWKRRREASHRVRLFAQANTR